MAFIRKTVDCCPTTVCTDCGCTGLMPRFYDFEKTLSTSTLPDVFAKYEDGIFPSTPYTANVFSELAGIPTNAVGGPILEFAVQNESTVAGVLKPAGVYTRTSGSANWVFSGTCPRRSSGRILMSGEIVVSNKASIPCASTPSWVPTGYCSNGSEAPCCNGDFLYWQGIVMNTPNYVVLDTLSTYEGGSVVYNQINMISTGTNGEYYMFLYSGADWGYHSENGFYSITPCNFPSAWGFGWSSDRFLIDPGCDSGETGFGPKSASCVASYDLTVSLTTIPFPAP